MRWARRRSGRANRGRVNAVEPQQAAAVIIIIIIRMIATNLIVTSVMVSLHGTSTVAHGATLREDTPAPTPTNKSSVIVCEKKIA